MKKFSKRLVSVITATVITSGFLGTSLPVSAAIQPTNTDIAQGLEQLKATTTEAIGGMYATNPSGVGKSAQITIDGSFSDWSEDMLVAQGVANDEPRTFRGSHEYPVYDDYALYASWDDTNLYVGWQIANPNDVTCGQNGVGTNEAKPYNADMPQMVGLDLNPSLEGTSKLADGKYIWGKNIEYANGIDTLLYFSSKTGAVANGPGSGVGSAGLFKVNESTGLFSYDPADCTLFKTEGIKYASVDGFLPKTMMGINGVADLGIDALYSSSSPWTDLLKTAHKTSLDTFYEMAIPLKSLGIDKNYIESNGIGLMHVSAYGSSATNSLPHDKVVLDNSLLPYTADTSTSNEKEDLDKITVPTARVGKAGTTPITVKPIISSFTADKTSPQEANAAINFNTVATSGTGALTYQYEVNSIVTRAFSSIPSFTWTPSIAGDYTVKVTVKDANGVTTTSTQTYIISEPIVIPDTPLVINSFTTTKNSPQIAGTTITLDTSATGGEGILQVRYSVFDGSRWTILKNYSTTTSTSWTPTKAGTYQVWSDVKNATGKVLSQMKTYVINPIVITTPLAIDSFTADVVSPQTVGTKVSLNTIASGGEGILQVRYSVFDGSRWTILKNFSTTTSTSWTPTKVGTYQVWSDVKDGTGKVISKSITYTIKAAKTIIVDKITVDKLSPQNIGTTITLTTFATSNTTLQYKYWVYDTDGNWTALNNYNTLNSVKWIPKLGGIYIIWVDVKDANGNISSKYINYLVQ